MTTAAEMIAKLDLQPHPEGGWYRETWRAEPLSPGGRGAGTSILFLLEAEQRSHWHRVDASELWIFQAGAPLTLRLAAGDAGECDVRQVTLGADPTTGQMLQQVVAPHEWQAAQGGEGWGLVACVVVPAFDFAGFELAPPGWEP